MIALLMTLFVPVADAYVYWGNPTLKLEVNTIDGDALYGASEIMGVRLHRCDADEEEEDIYVFQTIDPVAGWELSIPEGDYCEAQIRWDGPTKVYVSDGVIRSNALVTTLKLEPSGQMASTPLGRQKLTGVRNHGGLEVSLSITSH